MARRQVLAASALASVALLSACSDAVTAPSANDSGRLPQARVIIDHMAADQSSADFTITPSGGYFELGPHGIFFPENSICNPRTSAYGVQHWDAPCEVLREPIQIHAEIRDQDGRHWVQFTPELRFVPSADWSGAVFIYMRAKGAERKHQLKAKDVRPDAKHVTETTSELQILFAPFIGAAGIDESRTDPSLRTYEVKKTGLLFRRIKHFSAYNVRDRAAMASDAEL
jgi:hypothetical protein